MSKNLDNRSTPAKKKRAPRTVCNPEDIRYAMPAETVDKIEKISEAFDAAFRQLPDSPTDKAKKLFPFVGDIAHSSKIAALTGKTSAMLICKFWPQCVLFTAWTSTRSSMTSYEICKSLPFLART